MAEVTTEKISEATVRLPPDVHEALRTRAFEARTSQQQIILRALTEHLGKDGAIGVARNPKFEKWHAMLDDIFASGDQEAISAVVQNIVVFHRIVGAGRETAGVKTKARVTQRGH